MYGPCFQIVKLNVCGPIRNFQEIHELEVNKSVTICPALMMSVLSNLLDYIENTRLIKKSAIRHGAVLEKLTSLSIMGAQLRSLLKPFGPARHNCVEIFKMGS